MIQSWFDKPADPDAWHNVRAPGGYEWWYFDAQDPATDTQVVAIFLDGFVFHPGYLRRYGRYIRNPTKHAPPIAAEYPCAYFVVYRAGKIFAQFMTQYAPADFSASRDALDVRIGPNRAQRTANDISLTLQGTPWYLTWRGPRTLDTQLRAQFTFTPLLSHPPQERTFFSRQLAGADHHWVVANPLCSVTGSFTLGNESIPFTGRGYHDHNYGTAPIGPGLARWIWGRAIFNDRVLTFHIADPRSNTHPREIHLLNATATDIGELPVSGAFTGLERRNAWGLRYPTEIRIFESRKGCDEDWLKLTAPQVIDSSPFYLRAKFSATDGNRFDGHALCEIAYPHRLRWPVLSRMIEMSIHKQIS